MADLGALYPVSPDGTNSGWTLSAGTTAYSLVDNDPDTGQPDSDYLTAIYNASDDTIWLHMPTLPSDFDSMNADTSIRLYIGSTGTISNDTIALNAGITTADASEASFLAGASSTTEEQVTTWTGGTFTEQVYALSFTYVNTTATKAQWEAGYIHLHQVKGKSGGWDTGTLIVYAVEINGTYTPTAAVCNVSAALTNSQSIAVDVQIPVAVDVALTNSQAFAAGVATLPTVTADVALTNTVQSIEIYASEWVKVLLNDTLTGFHFNYGTHNVGPFYYATSGRHFIIGITTNHAKVSCLSAATITSWTNDDSSNEYEGTYTIGAIHVLPDGQKLHVLTLAEITSAYEVIYRRFDMSSRTWDQVSGTNRYDIISSSGTLGTDTVAEGVSLWVRSSDGEIFAGYSGAEENISGTDYERIYFNKQSGDDTWDGETSIDDGGTYNWFLSAIMENTSGAIFFAYGQPNSHTQSAARYKTYTDGGGLSSESDPTTGFSGASYAQGDPIQTTNFNGWSRPYAGFYDTDADTWTTITNNLTSYARYGPWEHGTDRVYLIGDSDGDGPVDVGIYEYDIGTDTLSSELVVKSLPSINDSVYQSGYANYVDGSGYCWVTISTSGTNSSGLDKVCVMKVKMPEIPTGVTANVALVNGQTFAADISIPEQVDVALTNSQAFAADVSTMATIIVDTALTNSQTFAADVSITFPTVDVDVALTNSQTIAAELSIPEQVDVALTNTQAFVADVSIPEQVDVALTNTQSISVDVSMPVQVSSDLTNTQAIAVDVTVPRTVDVVITNTQAIAVDVTVPVERTVDVALVNTQSMVTDISVPRTVDVALVNTQALSTDISVPRTVDVTLANTQAIAVDVSVPVQATLALVNTQAFAMDVSIPEQVTVALTNSQTFAADLTTTDTRYVTVALVNAQSMTTDIAVPRTLSVALTNAQAIDVDIGIPVQTAVALANPSQVLAVDVSVPVQVSSSLVNSESIAVDVSIPVQLTVSLTNTEEFFANVGVLEGVTANLALTNSQVIAVDMGVKVSVDGTLVNQAQAFAADVGILVGLEATLTNPAQMLAVDAGVLVQVASSLLASPQTLAILVRMERAKTFVSTFTVRLFSSSVSLSTFTSSVTASQYSSHVDVDA